MVEQFSDRLPRGEGPPRNLSQRRPFVDYGSPREEIMGKEYLDPSYLYLDVGENPWGKPEDFAEKKEKISAKRDEAASRYLGDLTPAKQAIERKFGKTLPFVDFGIQGSAGIMHNLFTDFIKGRRFNVITVGTSWPVIVDFIDEQGWKTDRRDEVRDVVHNYYQIEDILGFINPLDMTLDETLFSFMAQRVSDTRRNLMIYLNNPNTPNGERANPRLVADLIRLVVRKGWYLVIDEVLADTLPNEESAINMIADPEENTEGVFVVRSLSKGADMAGEGIAYVVASAKTGGEYQRIVVPRAIRGSSALTINTFFEMNLEEHYKKTREKVEVIKPKWIKALNQRGIKTLHTSDSTYILTVDGGREDSVQALLDHKILTVPIIKFGKVFPAFASGRFFRSGIPMKAVDNKLVPVEDDEEIEAAAEQVYKALVT